MRITKEILELFSSLSAVTPSATCISHPLPPVPTLRKSADALTVSTPEQGTKVQKQFGHGKPGSPCGRRLRLLMSLQGDSASRSLGRPYTPSQSTGGSPAEIWTFTPPNAPTFRLPAVPRVSSPDSREIEKDAWGKASPSSPGRGCGVCLAFERDGLGQGRVSQDQRRPRCIHRGRQTQQQESRAVAKLLF